MHRLMRGLVDFRQGLTDEQRQLFGSLADNQKPEVLLITCADSRVVPSIFSNAGPGDLFTVRTVGNLVAPADAAGIAQGDVSEASAIEYALEVLGIRDIAVCGHSNCGAMKAMVNGREKLVPTAPNLVEWLKHADASLKRTEPVPEGSTPEDALSYRNVLQQLEHIATYSPVAKRLGTKEVRLHGLFFEIGPARVRLYEGLSKGFVPLDEHEVARLMRVPA